MDGTLIIQPPIIDHRISKEEPEIPNIEPEIPNIEQELFNRGFIPIDQIVSEDKFGKPIVKYIKVVTENGYKAFVDPDDVEGLINIKKETNILKPRYSVSSIPYSIKNGSLECLSNIACGIAYECKDELCVINKNTIEEPQEIVFTTMPDITKVATMDYISYPIVRMEDILANPTDVIQEIQEVTDRLHREEKNKCLEDTIRTNQSFGKMANQYDEMVLRYREAFRSIENNLSFLQSLDINFSNQNNQIILLNIVRRLDLQKDLFKMCHKITEFKNRFDQLSMELTEMNQILSESYSDLNIVFTE